LPCSAQAKVVDYSNPYAITEVLNSLEGGEYGSVTKDIDALITRKMQVLGPYFAKYPTLIDRFLKVVTDQDEKSHHSDQNVIDLDDKQIQRDVGAPKREKDVPAAPCPVVIIDSDEEDDRDQKSFHAYHEVVLPKRQSPALKMIVSFALLLFLEYIIFWNMLCPAFVILKNMPSFGLYIPSGVI